MAKQDSKLMQAMSKAFDDTEAFIAQAKSASVDGALAEVLQQILAVETTLHKAVGDVVRDLQDKAADLQRQLYELRMSVVHEKAGDGSVKSVEDVPGK